MRAIPVIAVCCVTLLMASVAGAAQKFKPAPGCKRESRLVELEATLKGEGCGQALPQKNGNFEVRICASR